MNVVGHNYVPTDSNIVFRKSPRRIKVKRFTNLLERIQLFAIARSERHEVQRRVWKNAHQPWGTAFDHAER